MYVSEMFDQLRLLLNDAADSQVPFTTKKLYLNRGIAKLWPSVYQVSEATITLASDQYQYDLLKSTYGDLALFSVEYSYDGGADHYRRLNEYDVFPPTEDQDGYIRVGFAPVAGAKLRLRFAKPVAYITANDYAAASAAQWNGPDAAIELPVLYAMGLYAASKLDDRQDTYRYSTTQAQNGVTDTDIIGSSQMWFGQFAEGLAQFERPLPIARD